MKLRRDFYCKHSEHLPVNPEDRGEVTEHYIYSSDETICLSLEYADEIHHELKEDEESEAEANGRRFLRCPAAVTVGLLKRLIRGKYGLNSNHALDVLYGDSFLCDEYSLVDLAYIYNWQRKGPMRLKYRIYQLEEDSNAVPNGIEVDEEHIKEIKQEANIKDEECPKTKEPTKDVDIAVEVISSEGDEKVKKCIPNVNSGNGFQEETLEKVRESVLSVVRSTCENVSEENQTSLSQPESNGEATQAPARPIVEGSVEANGETLSSAIEQKAEISSNISVSSTDTVGDVVESLNVPNQLVSSNSKPVSPLNHKMMKPPPLSWNENANRVGVKRSSNSVTSNDNHELALPPAPKRATPSSPSKTPRFFKIRNSPQPSGVDHNAVTCKSPGTSIASVTESPVQEVAVNLTKVPSSPKKTSDKERLMKEGRIPSPRQDGGPPNPVRNYTSSSPSKRQLSPNSSVDDATRVRNLLPPISLGAPTSSSPSVDGSIQQLRYPGWLNMARGVPNRPAPLTLGTGSPFNNQPPLSPAHFISSLIASHSYPYLSAMSLPPPPESKKSHPTSTSSSSASASQQTHKSTSSRSSGSFPTPTFNLNALQQCGYPAGLSPLLPSLPRELVGSFYHSSFVARPFLPTRGGSMSASTKSLPPTSASGNVTGAGFHPSLPPTVTTVTSNSLSSLGRKSSPSLRPLVPRRSVAPPPPLVPIGATPAPVRSPPTLLPIKDVVEKDPLASKASPSTATTAVNVVESCIVRTKEDLSGSHSNSTGEISAVSKAESQNRPSQENGRVTEESAIQKKEIPQGPSVECSSTNANVTGSTKIDVDIEKQESKVVAGVTTGL